MAIVLTRQHALAAGLVVASLCVVGTGALVGAEAVLRHRERSRLTVPGTMPLLYYRHTRLERALVRDADYFGWVHTNRHGFRGAAISEQKPPGVFRIMAVGASTTFDTQVRADSATWPARLQYWLGQRAPGMRVEVINAGVPAYGLLDAIIRLQTELHRFSPDLMIVYHGHNELNGAFMRAEHDTGLVPTPDEAPPVSPWTHWLSRHSLLYTKLLLRFELLRLRDRGARFASTATGASRAQDALAQGERKFERDLSSFLAVAASMHIPVALIEPLHVTGTSGVPSPAQVQVWQHSIPYASPEHVLEGYRRFTSVIHRVGRRNGVPVLPTQSFGLVGEQWYAEGDPIHFNDQGADRMASHLASALVAQHLLVPADSATGSSRTIAVNAPRGAIQ